MIRIVHYLANVGGGFSAAFLMYVTISCTLSLVLSNRFSEENRYKCWPLNFPTFAGSTDGCVDPLAKSLWLVSVHLPRDLIAAPAVSLYAVIYSKQHLLEDGGSNDALGLSSLEINLISFLGFGAAGFLAWYQRSPFVAWSLCSLVIGQVAFIYFHLAFFTAT